MLNINNLYSEFEKKQKGRFETYQDILLKCHKKIKLSANNLQTDVYFKVPDYIFGKPLYDVNACTYFIISQLVQNGFFATYVGKHTIFISWKNHKKSMNEQTIQNNPQMISNTMYHDDNFLNKSSSYYKEKNNQLLEDDIKLSRFTFDSHSFSRNMPVNPNYVPEPVSKPISNPSKKNVTLDKNPDKPNAKDLINKLKAKYF